MLEWTQVTSARETLDYLISEHDDVSEAGGKKLLNRLVWPLEILV